MEICRCVSSGPRQCESSSAHECCCLSFGPKRCDGSAHECCCESEGPWRCRGSAHECLCLTRGPMVCDSDVHPCLCDEYGSAHCRGTGQHWCVCRYKYNIKCLAAEGMHDCSCLTREPGKCLSDGRHQCVCAHGEPGKCLSDGRHQCVCAHGEPYEASPPTWRSCRLWGGHDGRLVEARGVRALVVASHGSAPNAEISSPILRGFAGLPYQLRLCVAEIAWVMAAADE